MECAALALRLRSELNDRLNNAGSTVAHGEPGLTQPAPAQIAAEVESVLVALPQPRRTAASSRWPLTVYPQATSTPSFCFPAPTFGGRLHQRKSTSSSTRKRSRAQSSGSAVTGRTRWPCCWRAGPGRLPAPGFRCRGQRAREHTHRGSVLPAVACAPRPGVRDDLADEAVDHLAHLRDRDRQLSLCGLDAEVAMAVAPALRLYRALMAGSSQERFDLILNGPLQDPAAPQPPHFGEALVVADPRRKQLPIRSPGTAPGAILPSIAESSLHGLLLLPAATPSHFPAARGRDRSNSHGIHRAVTTEALLGADP